jgi:hypothetical protein
MLVQPRIRVALAVLLSVIGGGLCRAAIPRPTPVDVCSVVAHPQALSGKRVTVRGLLDFAFPSNPVPPPLLRGNCGYGIILLLIGDTGPEYQELWKAETEPPTSSAARRIWATFTGTLRVYGERFFLEVDAIKDIVIRQNLAVQHAEVPAFPNEGDAGGTVRISLAFHKGRVTHARVVGKADAALARAALVNVRSWRFSSLLNAQITTLFDYRVATSKGCPPSNPQIVLNLPRSVVLTRWRRLPCNPSSGVGRRPSEQRR